jgi:subtilisin family serine protease
MKKITFFILVLIATLSCKREEKAELIINPLTQNPSKAFEPAVINDVILRQLYRNDRFEWSMTDPLTVWSAAVQSDSILSIGFQPSNEKEVANRLHQIDVQQKQWRAVRDKIVALVVAETNLQYPGKKITAADLLPFGYETVLPVVDIKVSSLALIEKLRAMPEVRYVEPMGYDLMIAGLRSDSGCSNASNFGITANDYSIVDQDAKIAWNLPFAKIPQAWLRSTGAGITIALLDTGTSPDQRKLGTQFASGQSTGRSITRLGTYAPGLFNSTPDGPNDRCGHGTQMSGIIAAPRTTGGTPIGVAYNANLVTIRVTSDVIIDGSGEKKGVADGLVLVGNNPAIKIVSMSIGNIISSGQVADAVRYAYGKGKMLFAAAGTSLTWTSWVGVIFPANMSECIAVTGVQDALPLNKCSTCHEGNDVEFVAVMERSDAERRKALTLAMNGDQPSTVGGSSASTAITAGIAALVWATNPSLSREQVYTRLQTAASFYPNRNKNHGWGIIDADLAVGSNK